jgi:phage baseplate assembly protein W
MNYRVGSRIRFRLLVGKQVEGVIRAILKTPEGMRYRVEYGSNLATINPEQIVQPPGGARCAKGR